ncbi:hypothetical protein V1293_006158 [Bradyrhizobium sp. AZCC 1693]
MIRFSIGAQRLASGLIAGAVLVLLAATPSHAAAKIQRLVSPGGIEAWFVQDATVPLIAMEYAFGGGAPPRTHQASPASATWSPACSTRAPAISIPKPFTSASSAALSN